MGGLCAKPLSCFEIAWQHQYVGEILNYAVSQYFRGMQFHAPLKARFIRVFVMYFLLLQGALTSRPPLRAAGEGGRGGAGGGGGGQGKA